MLTRTRAAGTTGTLLLLTSVAFAQRNPDVRINTNPAGGARSVHPRLVVAGDNVYAVWQDARSGADDIYFTHSNNRGATWQTTDTKLDTGVPAGNSIAPELCAAGNAVYVVWEEHRQSAVNGDIFFNRSLDGGATWLASDVRLDTGTAAGAADSRSPKICCTGSSVYVVWYDQRSGAFDVYCNRSLDGGATWFATDVRLDTGDAPGAHASTFAQVCCQGSNVVAAWTDNRGGNDDVYVNRSSDGGTTWFATAMRVDHSTATAFSADPQIACAGSSVYVVWEDDRNGQKDIYLNRSTDGGATWLAGDVRLDRDAAGSGASVDPQLCCSGSAVYVIWLDTRISFVWSQVYLNRSTDAGATWLANDVLLNQSSMANCFSFNPQLACAGNLVCVAWETQACGGLGNADIYCTRSTDLGASWLPFNVRLDTTALGSSRSGEPRVAVDSNRCSVVWTDYRNSTTGRSDIYWNVPFAQLPYGAATPGSGGLAPRLAGNGAATLGGTMAIDASNGLGGAAGALLIGGPGSKVAIPLLGGTLLVLPAISLPVTLGGAVGVPGAGTGSLPFVLPASASSVGVNLNFQELFLDAGAPAGLSMSNAVELWIG